MKCHPPTPGYLCYCKNYFLTNQVPIVKILEVSDAFIYRLLNVPVTI